MSKAIKAVLAATTVNLTKLREISGDSVQFVLDDHTVELPQSLTVGSELPMPRKGNPGTVKTSINSRRTVCLNKDTATERNVPIIVKISTSFPVGSTAADRTIAITNAVALLLQSEADRDELAYKGLLPE